MNTIIKRWVSVENHVHDNIVAKLESVANTPIWNQCMNHLMHYVRYNVRMDVSQELLVKLHKTIWDSCFDGITAFGESIHFKGNYK